MIIQIPEYICFNIIFVYAILRFGIFLAELFKKKLFDFGPKQ